jgi:hypothetical protein
MEQEVEKAAVTAAYMKKVQPSLILPQSFGQWLKGRI